MAAGDVNSRTVFNIGPYRAMVGTCEAADGTAVALADTKSRLVFAIVQNADDEEGARLVLNSNNGTADSANGSIYVTSAAGDDDTWNYLAILR